MIALKQDQAMYAIRSMQDAWMRWKPRVDNPANFEQQTAYVEARDLVSFALGGTGSGKTESSARKCADFLMIQEPPRVDTPFWVLGETYKQVCATCWGEKLHGMKFLPDAWIDSSRSISYYNAAMRWPAMVPLKKWANGNNWVLEFMSYDQGREAMQARSIGGFWFSEQFPWHMFEEVLARCRMFLFPGGQFCEFTPLNPELCMAMEKVMDDPPKGWGIYRLNTEANRGNLAKDWFDTFYANVPDEMMATRMTGALATFEGVIYQTFNPAVHVTDDDSMVWRSGMHHFRATDWGASAEHPFATVFGCYDGAGEWTIYDEYWNNSQDAITQDHAGEVLARSIAWGWPEPDFFSKPDDARSFFVKKVKERIKELRPGKTKPIEGSRYGECFADPSRPGEMNAFNYYGIPTSSASNDVYKGIDLVRSKLKVNPTTGEAKLYFHERCRHAREEMRKYRWVRKRPNVLWTTAAPRPVPLKKDDDVADCIRYLINSAERGRGQAPSSADSRIDGGREGLLLDRAGNGHVLRPMQSAREGFFRK
jgi:phage terminase large subunit-like protein